LCNSKVEDLRFDFIVRADLKESAAVRLIQIAKSPYGSRRQMQSFTRAELLDILQLLDLSLTLNLKKKNKK